MSSPYYDDITNTLNEYIFISTKLIVQLQNKCIYNTNDIFMNFNYYILIKKNLYKIIIEKYNSDFETIKDIVLRYEKIIKINYFDFKYNK